MKTIRVGRGVWDMSGINSSLTVAEGISAQFSQVASGFSSVNEVGTKAERTTVSGNNQAKNSVTRIHDRAQRLSNAIARDGNNIHSVAKKFSQIDQKIKRSIDLAIFSPKLGGGKYE